MAAFLIVGSVVASVFHDNVSFRPSPPPTIANFSSALFPFVFRVVDEVTSPVTRRFAGPRHLVHYVRLRTWILELGTFVCLLVY